MVKINIICIGSLKEKYWKLALDEYKKRLSGFCKLSVVELEECKLCNKSINEVTELEGLKIIQKVPKGSYIIALCIEGKELDSINFSKLIDETSLYKSSEITFIIGGSWGLSKTVKNKADICLSMSKMTFTHQMFRVILLEQIYRAFQILTDGKYHK